MSYKELEGLSWEGSVAEGEGRLGTLWRPDLGALSLNVCVQEEEEQ